MKDDQCWKQVKLGELVEFKNGINYRASDVGKKVKLVSVSSFQDSFYLNEGLLEEVELTSLTKEYLLEDGDFLFVRSNGNKKLIGRVLYIEKTEIPITFSGFTIRARNKSEDVLDKYCAVFMSSNLVKKQFMTMGGGSNINNLNQNILSEVFIKLPPKKEQSKILEILDAWNNAIELKEQLIEQKQLQKKGLMQNLLSGQVRLNGFKEKWKTKNIGDCISESKEIANRPDLNKKVTVKLNLGGVKKREVNPIEKEGATTQYVRRRGQFIYGKQNLHKGALGLIPPNLDGYQTSSDIPAFDFNEGVHNEWFFYYMSQSYIHSNLEKISTGTGSKRINPKDLFAVKLKVPAFEEQCAIAKVIEKADREVTLLEKELNLLKQQKKGLMQLLLTGEVRVNV